MRTRRASEHPHKERLVSHAAVGQETVLSFNDDLIRRWCLEARCGEPPRLCREDLTEPERFRARLEAWIRTQC